MKKFFKLLLTWLAKTYKWLLTETNVFDKLLELVRNQSQSAACTAM